MSFHGSGSGIHFYSQLDPSPNFDTYQFGGEVPFSEKESLYHAWPQAPNISDSLFEPKV